LINFIKSTFRKHPEATRNIGFILTIIVVIYVLASLVLGGIPFSEAVAVLALLSGIMTAAGDIFLKEEPLTWQKQESLLYKARATLTSSSFSLQEKDILAAELVMVFGSDKMKMDIAGLGRMISNIDILGARDRRIPEIIKEIDNLLQRHQKKFSLTEYLTPTLAIEKWAKYLDNPLMKQEEMLEIIQSTNNIPERVTADLSIDTINKIEYFFSHVRCENLSSEAEVFISRSLQKAKADGLIECIKSYIEWMTPNCERIFSEMLEQLERPEVPKELRRNFLDSAQKAGFLGNHYHLLGTETLEEVLKLPSTYRTKILLGRLHGKEDHTLQVVINHLDPEDNNQVAEVLKRLPTLSDQYAEWTMTDFLEKSPNNDIPRAVLQEAVKFSRAKNFRKTYFEILGKVGTLIQVNELGKLIPQERDDEIKHWMERAKEEICKRPPVKTFY